ncbi:hypothetical protein K8R62_00320 [bacterium]|nr:hypothetical protein [bacterium]
MNILAKIKKANLLGRGGGCFSTTLKWKMVDEASGNEKYIVCNASEGEPGVKKDGYILKHRAEEVIEGIEIARSFLNKGKKKIKVKAYIYINGDYYQTLGPGLLECIGKKDIELFVKPHGAGYIGGEETSILNSIEGERIEPRLRPPYPTTNGLWGCPTLINNVETLLNVSLVNSDNYRKERYYTVSGKAQNKGVFYLPDDWTIEKVLKETRNYPFFDFFVQVGGDGSGVVLNKKQLKIPVNGAGTIKVYKLQGHKAEKIMKSWLDFFLGESCGQCTPCREGIYRLSQIVKKDSVDWILFKEILENLEESSFCGLGCAVPIPLKSYLKNVAKLPGVFIQDQKLVCKCFK